MKKTVVLILLLFKLFLDQTITYAQSNQTDTLSKGVKQHLIGTRLDFMLIPTFIFNNACIGLSFQKQHGIEYGFLMACRYTPVFGFFNLNLNFNSNIYWGKSNTYIPIWVRLSNTRSAFTWWDSPVMPHSLKISIGSGIGFRYAMRNNYSIRTEMGIGLSLIQESTIGGIFPYTLNLKDYNSAEILSAYKFKFTICKLIN
jgi:hypothetical protein